MTDVQALKQYADHRDAQAFHLLVAQYQQLVYSAARRRLANQHDIDDVVQLTFLKLANASDKIRDDLASWLYTTTLNNANELIRKDQTRRRHEALAPSPPPSPGALADALHQDEWQTLSPKIDDAILALPPDQRTLIIQHFFQNRSQRDLAEQLHTTQPTIHRRLHSAIASIRESLRAAGHLCTAPAVLGLLHNAAQLTVPAPLSAQLTKIGLAGTGAKPVITAKPALSLGAKLAIAASMLIITAISGFLFNESITHKNPSIALPAFGPSAPSPIAAIADVWARNQPANPAFKIEDPFESVMPPGGTRAINASTFDVYVDRAGTVHFAGEITDADGANHGFLRAKPAGSVKWSTIRSVNGAPVYSVAESAGGDLYVAYTAWGILMRPAGSDQFIKQPVSHGKWTSSSMANLTFDADGSLYFAGSLSGNWRVVKRAPGEQEFRIIDSFSRDPSLEPMPASERLSVARCLAIVKTGPLASIYVAGFAFPLANDVAPQKYHWIVRNSADAGATWSTVDDFSPSSTKSYRATSVCSDNLGNVLVAGYADDNHWIVRKCATDHPDQWVTVDEMAGGRAWNVKAGPDGSLYVVGQENDPRDSTKYRAIVRSNASGQWRTIFQYQSTFDMTTFDTMTYDKSGRVYLAGTVHGSGISACMLMTTTFDALAHAAISTEPSQPDR